MSATEKNISPHLLSGLRWQDIEPGSCFLVVALHFALRFIDVPAIGGLTLSVIAMGFTAGGYITPVTDALLQEAIDIIAIANALRLSWGHRIKTDLNN